MNEVPTPKQGLILWCLLGRHGSALQSALVPRVDKADREALVAGRYLETAKEGRSLRLTVTDRGWNWAGDHLGRALPANFRVLQDWLERLQANLTRSGGTLAEFVGTPSEGARPAQPQSPARRAAKPSKKLGPKQLRARIETAYLALTGGETAKAVRLSALRAHLSDLDRATLDAGLAAILSGDPKAHLSQFSDPRSLTSAEREAAFSPAGEPFHILWIQS